MEELYLDLIPSFYDATKKILDLPVASNRKLNLAYKYAPPSVGAKQRTKRKPRKKNVK